MIEGSTLATDDEQNSHTTCCGCILQGETARAGCHLIINCHSLSSMLSSVIIAL